MRDRIFATFLSFWTLGLSALSVTYGAEKDLWLLVTTDALEESAEPLIRRRSNQGFEVERLVGSSDQALNEATIASWIQERQRKAAGRVHVLLLGGWDEGQASAWVPMAQGKHQRMKGALTDHAYGMPDDQGVSRIAVGRLPAASPEEAVAMVDKVIRFEDQPLGLWTQRAHLWIGDPGGDSDFQRGFAQKTVMNAVRKNLALIHPRWEVCSRALFGDSEISVSPEGFEATALGALREGHCFTIYAGHSGARGLWSAGNYVLPRESWSQMRIQNSPGVLVSCGCFAAQLEGRFGEGYAISAIRNPTGPAACIGACDESYGIAGHLALEAFASSLGTPTPLECLGDYWLRIQEGLGRGEVSWLTFKLYDQADGSGGAVPLEAQRREHAEMWTLLGDPAMRFPVLGAELNLELKWDETQNVLQVSGRWEDQAMPKRAQVLVRIQGRPEVLLNERLKIEGDGFEHRFRFPELLHADSLEVRAFIEGETDAFLGVASLNLEEAEGQ